MNEICRICLGNKALSSIFISRESSTISTNIMKVAKVEIHPDDGLPNKICLKCTKKLENCITFIKQCEDTDLKLRLKQNINQDIYTLNNDEHCIQNENSMNFGSTLEDDTFKNSFNEESDNTLDNSVQMKQKKVEKQQCFTCGKVMSSRFRLMTHLRTHTGERPFSCPHCQKKFTLAQNLKVHLRIHTGEKPLHCSDCGATFAQTAGLAAHRRKHTGQNPYKCTLCPRTFRTIGHLHYHTRRHTGEKNFECDTCGRSFITRSDLKQHLRTHLGEKPHICSFCGLRLTRQSNLKRHIQYIHNGNQPFLCSECPSLQFTHKTEFEKHKKKHVESKDNESI